MLRKKANYYYYSICLVLTKVKGGGGIGPLKDRKVEDLGGHEVDELRADGSNCPADSPQSSDGHSPISRRCQYPLVLFGFPFLKGSPLHSRRNPNNHLNDG